MVGRKVEQMVALRVQMKVADSVDLLECTKAAKMAARRDQNLVVRLEKLRVAQ